MPDPEKHYAGSGITLRGKRYDTMQDTVEIGIYIVGQRT